MLITTAMIVATEAPSTVIVDLSESNCADLNRSGDQRGIDVCEQTRSCLEEATGLLQGIHNWSGKLRGNAAQNQIETTARRVNDRLISLPQQRKEEVCKVLTALKCNLSQWGARFGSDNQFLIELVVAYSCEQRQFELPKL